ncbi:uncharacterized protein ARMOST_01610 [Armillaria ostoyae]|uniref:Uncharacterized protein n=1 Tax=Armillaria ostoyae TaxID=47428 RepID=A0A284QPE8_ARMOS|nr:uncharacterized protein ARMOST_01610 [Armillaria ostoyae]
MTRRRNVPLGATSIAYGVLSAVDFQSKCSNEDRPDCKGAFESVGSPISLSHQFRFSIGLPDGRIEYLATASSTSA